MQSSHFGSLIDFLIFRKTELSSGSYLAVLPTWICSSHKMWNGCWRSEVYNSFWRVAPSPALSQRWRNAVENLSSFPHKKREGGSLLWAFFTWTEGSEPACRAGADGNGCASTVFRDAHAAPRGSRAAAAAWSLGPLKSMAVINTCFWAPPGTRANFDSLCTFPSPVPRGLLDLVHHSFPYMFFSAPAFSVTVIYQLPWNFWVLLSCLVSLLFKSQITPLSKQPKSYLFPRDLLQHDDLL